MLQIDCIDKYGPVTMIVPASGHQVRCIPWVQMGTFNKEIGFLLVSKFFALNIFCGEYLQARLHLILQIWWKNATVKDVPINNYVLLNIQSCKLMFGKMVSAPIFGSSPDIH